MKELPNTKYCPKCSRTLAAYTFGTRTQKGILYLRSYCKACEKVIGQKFSVANPEYRKAYNRKAGLKRTAGITETDYAFLYDKQNGLCAICGTTEPGGRGVHFSVDHCHTTGKVRGLLCNNCNQGLGYYRDSPLLLRLAAEYINDSQRTKAIQEAD